MLFLRCFLMILYLEIIFFSNSTFSLEINSPLKIQQTFYEQISTYLPSGHQSTMPTKVYQNAPHIASSAMLLLAEALIKKNETRLIQQWSNRSDPLSKIETSDCTIEDPLFIIQCKRTPATDEVSGAKIFKDEMVISFKLNQFLDQLNTNQSISLSNNAELTVSSNITLESRFHTKITRPSSSSQNTFDYQSLLFPFRLTKEAKTLIHHPSLLKTQDWFYFSFNGRLGLTIPIQQFLALKASVGTDQQFIFSRTFEKINTQGLLFTVSDERDQLFQGQIALSLGLKKIINLTLLSYEYSINTERSKTDSFFIPIDFALDYKDWEYHEMSELFQEGKFKNLWWWESRNYFYQLITSRSQIFTKHQQQLKEKMTETILSHDGTQQTNYSFNEDLFKRNQDFLNFLLSGIVGDFVAGFFRFEDQSNYHYSVKLKQREGFKNQPKGSLPKVINGPLHDENIEISVEEQFFYHQLKRKKYNKFINDVLAPSFMEVSQKNLFINDPYTFNVTLNSKYTLHGLMKKNIFDDRVLQQFSILSCQPNDQWKGMPAIDIKCTQNVKEQLIQLRASIPQGINSLYANSPLLLSWFKETSKVMKGIKGLSYLWENNFEYAGFLEGKKDKHGPINSMEFPLK